MDEMSVSELLVADERGVRTITLNRPATLNALVPTLMAALADAVADAARDPSVGCVVVTGAGKGFCSGGDLRDGGTRFDPDVERGGRIEQAYDQLRNFYEAPRLLHDMPKPSIAMVNGPAAGAGIGLMGACDLRFVGTSASLVSAFDRIGAGGDFGTTWFLTKILGTGGARELLLLGEKLSAQEAFRRGLYTKLFPDAELREATMAAAHKLADGPRMGWRYMKANLNLAEHAAFAIALDHEALAMNLSTVATAQVARGAAALNTTSPASGPERGA